MDLEWTLFYNFLTASWRGLARELLVWQLEAALTRNRAQGERNN